MQPPRVPATAHTSQLSLWTKEFMLSCCLQPESSSPAPTAIHMAKHWMYTSQVHTLHVLLVVEVLVQPVCDCVVHDH